MKNEQEIETSNFSVPNWSQQYENSFTVSHRTEETPFNAIPPYWNVLSFRSIQTQEIFISFLLQMNSVEIHNEQNSRNSRSLENPVSPVPISYIHSGKYVLTELNWTQRRRCEQLSRKMEFVRFVMKKRKQSRV